MDDFFNDNGQEGNIDQKQEKFQIANFLVEFKKNNSLSFEDLQLALDISRTDLEDILNFNFEEISLDALEDIELILRKF